MGKKHFISFGAGIFTNQVKRVTNEASSTGWFDKVIIETPETISEFLEEHKEFISSNKRGYGYWIWKPYIILKELQNLNDGDFLFYTDAGAYILPHRKYRFDEYCDILRDSQCPILTFGTSGFSEIKFQKKRTLKRFGLDTNESFLLSNQIESGVICIMKNDNSLKVIREWFDVALEDNHSIFNDDGCGEEENLEFIDHRHDQSVLSILCKYNSCPIIVNGEAYGLGPFFSQRMTDKGPREFSPDWFRREPDYNQDEHPFLENYLESKSDPNWYKSHPEYDHRIHNTEMEFADDMFARYGWYDYNNPNSKNE